MPRVRPVGDVDVQRLENGFVSGYREGDRVFYISIFDDSQKTQDVSEEVMAGWSPLWQQANDAFEAELREDDDYIQFQGKLFFVWEGNHRLAAWMRYINTFPSNDPDWHYSVHAIVLDPRGHVGNLLHAMSDINWYGFSFFLYLHSMFIIHC